jgi:hypothetical protein
MKTFKRLWQWLNEGDYLGSYGKNTRNFELQGFKGTMRQKAEKELEILREARGEGVLELERQNRVRVLKKFLRVK